MDTKKLLQISSLMSQGATSVSPPGTAPAEGGKRLQESAASGIQAQIEKEAAEKKGKGWGKLGSTLGSALGVLAAPATGGASLAAFGALGGAAGGALGDFVDTGTVDPANLLNYGAQGAASGIAGWGAGKINEALAPAPIKPLENFMPAAAGNATANAATAPVVGPPGAGAAAALPTGPTAPVVPAGAPVNPPGAYSAEGLKSKIGNWMNGQQLLSTMGSGAQLQPMGSGVMGPRRYKYDENGQLVGAQ